MALVSRVAQMKYRKIPWKRNYAKIPKSISDAMAKIDSDLLIVAQSQKVPHVDIELGEYAHLGITDSNGEILFPDEVIPPAEMGKFSTRNREGWEYPRKDLPKITRTYTWETPNFGDASTYGTHMHSQDREVYQREIYEPQMYSVTAELMNESAGSTALIKFAVNHILDKNSPSFQHDLLHCINLLQENTGTVGIFASDATRKDFVKTVALDWEVFPPGTAQEVIDAISKSAKGGDSGPSGVMEERVKLFASLKPKMYMRGTASFGSYIGAQFADDLVIFENVNYGNALYVLFEDWEDVSKRSRTELLKGTSINYERFTHVEGWEDRFNEFMRLELKRRKKK